MSEVARLARKLDAATDDDAAALTELLGLAAVGRRVTGATVFGRGPAASVDVQLDDGAKLTFDRFGDIAKPAALSAYLVTLTGVHKAFKGAEAGAVAGAIFRLATHHAEADQDDAAREWALEFLRLAPAMETDMGDQAARWRAFRALALMNPARDTGEERSAFALAQASTVLVDQQSGVRYVRAGWLQSYVRREVGGMYSPAALTVQMERVGWRRPNSQGRVKATSPTDGQTLSFRFYVVPADWEQVTEVSQVIAPYARTRTYARDSELTCDNPVTRGDSA